MEWDSPDPAYSKFLTPAQMEQVHQRRETVRQNLVYAAAAPEPRPDNYKDEEAYQSEVKQRDKAIDEFRKMNVPVDQAREMLILRYTRVKSDGRKGTLTETYPQRLGSLLKLYGQ